MSDGPPPGRLTPADLRRYSRHLLLPEVGAVGQRLLARSKVALVGVGGLGAPAALYLAAAGVGEIAVIDADRVDLSNLQRQVLYTTAEVGHPKAGAATSHLHALNPAIRIRGIEERLTSRNALELLAPFDVVVDGSDNFPTRYLVNDACVLLGKPDVFGSVYRFEGQASVFDGRRGPCYRCLFPEPPPPDAVPSCAEGGVLGVLPGLIGLLQAVETLKLLLGIGEPLVGRLLLVDALAMSFREVRLRKAEQCAVCGPDPTVKHLVDYAAFCGVPESLGDPALELTAQELRPLLAGDDPPLLLDVRTPNEFAVSHLPEARRVSLPDLAESASTLATAGEVVLYCSTGQRSRRGLTTLKELGFTKVRHLKGGLEAWVDTFGPASVTSEPS